VTSVFIADTYNHSIRRYDPKKQSLETVVGDGKRGKTGDDKAEDARSIRMNEPSAIVPVSEERFVISDTNNHRLLIWDRTKKSVERLKVEGERSEPPPTAVETAESGTTRGGGVVASKKMSMRLPNPIAPVDGKVNTASPEIKIVLPEAYHLNEDAPSYARLFEGATPKEMMKQEWKADELKSGLVLKPKGLKAGTAYTLQGTFYYCLEAKNSVCEVSSVDQKIEVDPSGSESLVLNLSKAR
jgi:hypothetical protein